MRKWAGGLGLLALAACGGGGDGGGEAERGAPVATIATPEGRAEVRSGQAALGDLPAGIPAYPGATAESSLQITAAAEGQGGRITSMRTADSPGQVIDFYARAVEGAGYRVAQRAAIGPTAMLSAERGDGEGLHIQAIGADGGTTIQIIAGGR